MKDVIIERCNLFLDVHRKLGGPGLAAEIHLLPGE